MTFSIIGIDKKNKEMGIAIFSKAFGVGGIAPAIDMDIGAICLQSFPNVEYKEKAIKLMGKNSVEKTLSKLIKPDKEREKRQVILMDKKGRTCSFSGKENVEWSGSLKGKNCISAGNMLVGEQVLNKMVEGFESSNGELAERLMAALSAGNECGGDKRNKNFNSSALIIEKKGMGILGFGNRYIDMRIDYSDGNSIDELKNILRIKKEMDEKWKKERGKK